jgi:hypothetical protein
VPSPDRHNRPPASRRARVRDLRCIALLAVLVCAFLWPVLFTNRVLLPADMLLRMEPWRRYGSQFPEIGELQNPMLDPIQQYYPWRTYAAATIRDGEIPLWNPYMFCGAPFVGNGQSAVFYPVNALFYLMWPPRAFGYAAATNLFLAGLFTFLFLRSMEQRRWASLLGAIVFSYCGFMVVWLEFPTFLATGAWLPAALFAFQRAALASAACRHGSASMWAAGCGLSVTCMLLGGHLQIAFYALLTVGGFVVCRIIQASRKSLPAAGHLIRCGALALGLGLALSAVHLVPVLETGRATGRAVAPQYGDALELRLRWPNAVTLLVPDLFRAGIFHETWDGHPLNYIETCGYVGIVPLLVAPLGLAWRRRADGGLLVAILVVAILLAFGSPLNYPFFRFAPGYAVFRGIGRALFLSSFVLAILAARGASRIGDGLLRNTAPRTTRLAALSIGAVIVAAGFVLVEVGRGGYSLAEAALRFGGVDLVAYQWGKIGLFVGFALASALAIIFLGRSRPRMVPPLLVALVVADLFIFGLRFNPMVDAEVLRLQPRSRSALPRIPGVYRVTPHAPEENPLWTMPSNLPMTWGLEDVGGSDTVVWAPYQRVRRALSDASADDEERLESPIVDLLNVRYALTGVPFTSPPDGWTLAAVPDMLIYENHEAMPRAFVTYAAPRRLPEDQCITEMLRPDWRPWEPILIGEPRAADAASPPPSPDAAPEPGHEFTAAEVIEHSPNRVSVRSAADRDGLLILSDSCNPGWHAFVDSAERPILRVDAILRGVQLEAGRHQIDFIYLPTSFKLGAFLSCLALCFLSATTVRHLLQRRKPPK